MLGKLNESAQESEISELVEWALLIQERHFADVKDGSLGPCKSGGAAQLSR